MVKDVTVVVDAFVAVGVVMVVMSIGVFFGVAVLTLGCKMTPLVLVWSPST